MHVKTMQLALQLTSHSYDNYIIEIPFQSFNVWCGVCALINTINAMHMDKFILGAACTFAARSEFMQ